MAQNFFKMPKYNGHMSSKSSVVSSVSRMDYFNGFSRNMNPPPPLSTCSTESSIAPLTKEIEERLEVLSRLATQEEVSRISAEVIGRLNEACYEKVAQQVLPNSAAQSVYAESVRSSRVPTNNILGRVKNTVETSIHEAAKRIVEERRLNTIREESRKQDFVAPHNKNDTMKSKTRRKKPETLSGQIDDDSSTFQKPSASRGRPSKLAQASIRQPQHSKSNAKKRKDDIENQDIFDSQLDLTITKNSLRSSKSKTAQSKTKTVIAMFKQPMNNELKTPNSFIGNFDESNTSELDTIYPLPSEKSPSAFKIPTGPKKTALSPFMKRNTKRFNTSTPMK